MSTLRLRVAPGAARDEAAGRHAGGFELHVAAPPANGIPIVSRHASRDKTVALEGLDLDEIERRLAGAAGKDTE